MNLDRADKISDWVLRIVLGAIVAYLIISIVPAFLPGGAAAAVIGGAR